MYNTKDTNSPNIERVITEHWFSARGDCPQGTLVTSGDICGCHDRGREEAPGMEEVGVRDAAQHPLMPRAAPTEGSGLDVIDSAEAEHPCYKSKNKHPNLIRG